MLHGPGRPPSPDIVCLSHLRWDFVFQRPQHLLTRCAREHRVFFIEEPVTDRAVNEPSLRVDESGPVIVVVPQLPEGVGEPQRALAQRTLIDALLARERILDYVLWYYTPMALDFTRHLTPRAVLYDCMDELSGFKGASSSLKARECELMESADVVLTGGHSLYESKRHQHSNIHALPSSVDVAHFAKARVTREDPADQAPLARPRLGFYGVVDERMDLPLVEGIASARPDWQIVMVGPVVKIDPESLPRQPNIHYLGSKRYEELPQYLAGWDVALLPFARNEATRFISPTKTPEYMAAGKPVVSTSIADVVSPYGQRGLVRIADDVAAFVEACTDAMAEDGARRMTKADAFLRHMSWDNTWDRVRDLLDEVLGASTSAPPHSLARNATV